MCFQFSRTVAPETNKGPVLIALMRYYNWQKAIIVTSTDSVYFKSGLGIAHQLQDVGMSVNRPSAFEPGNFEISTMIAIKRSGTR